MGRAARARVESRFTLERSVRAAEAAIERTADRPAQGLPAGRRHRTADPAHRGAGPDLRRRRRAADAQPVPARVDRDAGAAAADLPARGRPAGRRLPGGRGAGRGARPRAAAGDLSTVPKLVAPAARRPHRRRPGHPPQPGRAHPRPARRPARRGAGERGGRARHGPDPGRRSGAAPTRRGDPVPVRRAGAARPEPGPLPARRGGRRPVPVAPDPRGRGPQRHRAAAGADRGGPGGGPGPARVCARADVVLGIVARLSPQKAHHGAAARVRHGRRRPGPTCGWWWSAAASEEQALRAQVDELGHRRPGAVHRDPRRRAPSCCPASTCPACPRCTRACR